MNPVLCEDVSILNVKVQNSPAAQNSDALDLESCRRAVIRGCTFDTGDDGICIKSGKDAAGRRIGVPTEDVLVEGCTVYHAHGGFTIGSEMSGGVRNLVVSNCTFMGTDIGLRFKSTRGRGGVVEKIFISDIRMEDIAGDAINFNLYYGGKSPLDETAGSGNQFPAGHGSDAAVPRHPHRKRGLPWRAKRHRAARPAGNAAARRHAEKCFHHVAAGRFRDGRGKHLV